MNKPVFASAFLAAAACVSAHLGALTSPRAGDTFAPGSTVNITWGVSVAHDGQDLAYSTDGGATWTTFATNLGPNVKAFAWTVPAKATTNAKIRVCQKENGSGTVAGCTDAHNAQRLTSAYQVPGGEVYTAISAAFTIQASSGVAPAPRIPGPGLPEARDIDALGRETGIRASMPTPEAAPGAAPEGKEGRTSVKVFQAP